MAIMSHPPSPLITARATKRSKANQTVTQLSPPLPAGKTLGTGIVQDGGCGKSGGEKKQPPNCYFHRVCREHSAAPQHGPSSEGPPSSLAAVMSGRRAVSRSMVGKGGLKARWLLVVLAWHGNRAPVPCRDMAPVHT